MIKQYQGLPAPDYTAAFKHARFLEASDGADPGPPGHQCLCDPEFYTLCGYCTLDEASILYNLARKFPGEWLEIGGHTGWSAAYLAGNAMGFLQPPASGMNIVWSLDPEFGEAKYNQTGNPALFLQRFRENIERVHPAMDGSGNRDAWKIRPIDQKSEDYFKQLKHNFTGTFDGVFIDGNHSSPHPLVDAMMSVTHLKQGGVIVLHDSNQKDVQSAIHWLEAMGFCITSYDTRNFITTASRNGESLPHVADPSINWFSYSDLFTPDNLLYEKHLSEAIAFLHK